MSQQPSSDLLDRIERLKSSEDPDVRWLAEAMDRAVSPLQREEFDRSEIKDDFGWLMARNHTWGDQQQSYIEHLEGLLTEIAFCSDMFYSEKTASGMFRIPDGRKVGEYYGPIGIIHKLSHGWVSGNYGEDPTMEPRVEGGQ